MVVAAFVVGVVAQTVAGTVHCSFETPRYLWSITLEIQKTELLTQNNPYTDNRGADPSVARYTVALTTSFLARNPSNTANAELYASSARSIAS